ncbi:MAG: hypothetical protein VR64_14820 [Desulfatitalea sp. BRH_c12]|nr:MAG: hypothetical protein VR64_14820 [Desulfatitalea sp. BRH_c12]
MITPLPKPGSVSAICSSTPFIRDRVVPFADRKSRFITTGILFNMGYPMHADPVAHVASGKRARIQRGVIADRRIHLASDVIVGQRNRDSAGVANSADALAIGRHRSRLQLMNHRRLLVQFEPVLTIAMA